MPKFKITWNIGFGEESEIVEANSKSDAQQIAYECALEDFHNYCVSYVEEIPEEEKEEKYDE